MLKTNVWLDAVVYSAVGVRAAAELVGKERVLFGTDHPFFPPLDQRESGRKWASVRTNVEAVGDAFQGDPEAVDDILGRNAFRILDLDVA